MKRISDEEIGGIIKKYTAEWVFPSMVVELLQTQLEADQTECQERVEWLKRELRHNASYVWFEDVRDGEFGKHRYIHIALTPESFKALWEKELSSAGRCQNGGEHNGD